MKGIELYRRNSNRNITTPETVGSKITDKMQRLIKLSSNTPSQLDNIIFDNNLNLLPFRGKTPNY